MATPVARDASRRAVEQGEKEAPLAELLRSSLIPFSLCLSLPHLISSEPDETLAPPLAVDADAVSRPGRIEGRGKLRREVLYHLAKPCFPGCGQLDGIVNLPQHHHRDTDRNTSPIPAVTGHPLRHRARGQLRGEHALLTNPFSLPAVLASRRNGRLFVVGSPRPPSPLLRRLPSLR